MKQVNKILPLADLKLRTADAEVFKPHFIINGQAQQPRTVEGVPEIYKNYVTQLSVALVQAGVVPAFAFFAESKEGSEGQPKLVLDILAAMLGHSDGQLLFTHALSIPNNSPQMRMLKVRAINAAIALKIVMKTYYIIPKN